MKTLQECKDEAAKKHGFKDFNETYVTKRSDWSIGSIYEEAAIIFAQEACREQREICALACDAANVAPSVILWEAITNAPEPKF